MQSAPKVTATFAAASISVVVGFGLISPYEAVWIPALARIFSTVARTPAAATPGSVTIKTFFLFNPAITSGSCEIDPAPNLMFTEPGVSVNAFMSCLF